MTLILGLSYLFNRLFDFQLIVISILTVLILGEDPNHIGKHHFYVARPTKTYSRDHRFVLRRVGSLSYFSSVVLFSVSYFLTVSYFFRSFSRKYDTGRVRYRTNTTLDFDSIVLIRYCSFTVSYFHENFFRFPVSYL